MSLFVLWQASLSANGTRYFWLDDDQMISMRYGRHLAQGKGLVWNDGERVEGYTNFLWTAIMAGVHLIGVPSAYTAVVIKLIIHVNLIPADKRLTRRLFVPFC